MIAHISLGSDTVEDFKYPDSNDATESILLVVGIGTPKKLAAESEICGWSGHPL
jgi:hypothetical protein